MTRIEKQIYAALAGDPRNPLKRTVVANLYAEAHSASHAVYIKIDWALLHAEIERVLGKRGLEECRRAATDQDDSTETT